MQIAVASTAGTVVDLHFGHTTVFHLFSAKDSTLTPLGTVEVEALSTGDKNHPFDPQKFEGIYSKLAQCKVIYCTKIGARPKEEMAKRSIEVVEFSGPVSSLPLE